MNCDDNLSMLAKLPVENQAHLHARDHAAGCRDCDRVTRVVLERERDMLMAFDELDSSVSAAQTAASALVSSRRRRRRVALYYAIGIGFVMAAIAVFMMTVNGSGASSRNSSSLGRENEVAHARALEVRLGGELNVPMPLPAALHQMVRIRQLDAAHEAELHTLLAGDDRASETSVACCHDIADDSSGAVHGLLCIGDRFRNDRAE